MRQFAYTFCVLFSFWIMLGGSSQAQQQTIGYVDTDLILSQIPEYEGIEEQLELISEEWREELDTMDQEIEELKEDFNAKEILYTDELREEKEQEIANLVKEREAYMEEKFGPEGDYYTRQQELLEPIQRKVYDAIRAVADREGIDFVFDRAQNASLLFADKAWNLNEEVLEELGISSE